MSREDNLRRLQGGRELLELKRVPIGAFNYGDKPSDGFFRSNLDAKSGHAELSANAENSAPALSSKAHVIRQVWVGDLVAPLSRVETRCERAVSFVEVGTEFSYVTGSNLAVDGGMNARPAGFQFQIKEVKAMSSLVVLITGALTGIGRAAAIMFAQEGAHIVVSGRRDNEG
jgi:hypothetical protein